MESKFVDNVPSTPHSYVHKRCHFNPKEFTCSQGIYMCKFLVNIKEMCRKGKHQETIKENIKSMAWYGITALMFASRHVDIKNFKLLESPNSIYKSLLTSPANKTWCDHLYVFHHKTFTLKYDIKISTHSGVVHHTDEWCSTFRHAHFILFYCGTAQIEN